MSLPDPTETFRQEARELLERLELGLLDLEKTPENGDLINSTFRALHTIKGSGAMFGFTEVASFVHEFETAFDRVRKGHSPVTSELIAVALDAKDHPRQAAPHRLHRPLSRGAAAERADCACRRCARRRSETLAHPLQAASRLLGLWHQPAAAARRDRRHRAVRDHRTDRRRLNDAGEQDADQRQCARIAAGVGAISANISTSCPSSGTCV